MVPKGSVRFPKRWKRQVVILILGLNNQSECNVVYFCKYIDSNGRRTSCYFTKDCDCVKEQIGSDSASEPLDRYKIRWILYRAVKYCSSSMLRSNSSLAESDWTKDTAVVIAPLTRIQLSNCDGSWRGIRIVVGCDI